MAKKIPKIRKPQTQMGFLDKLFSGIGGLSAVINHPNLRRSIQATTPSGQRSAAAMLRKYGKWGTRGMGLLNPWTAVPYALMAGAQYGVGKAFDPYRDATGKIGAAGHERLLQNRLNREALTRANAAKRGEVAWMDDPDFRMWGNEGGIARLL